MAQDKKDKIKKTKRITAQALFATLSISLIPIYTLIFGTKENPFENTLSGIGNAFDHKLSFIFWGSLTGLAIAYYTLYMFSKIGYQNKAARRFLYGSQACLVLTVLTPALKDVFPVWHFIHVTFSTLFALFFVASILSVPAIPVKEQYGPFKKVVFSACCMRRDINSIAVFYGAQRRGRDTFLYRHIRFPVCTEHISE